MSLNICKSQSFVYLSSTQHLNVYLTAFLFLFTFIFNGLFLCSGFARLSQDLEPVLFYFNIARGIVFVHSSYTLFYISFSIERSFYNWQTDKQSADQSCRKAFPQVER